MKVERVTLDKLHLDPANARAHPEHNMAAITASLEQFGQVEPLVVQKSTGKIIGGNGRYEAMRKHGWTECEVAYVDVDDTQAVALGIALNRTSELAVWDEKTLAALLDSVRNEVEPAAMGFTDEEINALIASVSATEGQTDPDAVPEAQEDAVTQTGDLWVLGGHRLVCGDSTEKPAWEAVCAETPHMVFTDPPYNVAIGDKAGGKHLANDDLPNHEFRAFLAAFASLTREYAGGDLYCAMSTREWPSIDQMLRECGYHWSTTVVWAKDSLVMGRGKYHSRYEPIWYGWPTTGKSSYCGDRKQDDVWEIPRPKRSEEHPTMKPVDLVCRAIENSSEPGQIVMDPFMGSGTTILAAEKTARRGYGIELAPNYCDVIVRRWQEFTGKDATLDGTDKTFTQIAEERLSVASTNDE